MRSAAPRCWAAKARQRANCAPLRRVDLLAGERDRLVQRRHVARPRPARQAARPARRRCAAPISTGGSRRRWLDQVLSSPSGAKLPPRSATWKAEREVQRQFVHRVAEPDVCGHRALAGGRSSHWLRRASVNPLNRRLSRATSSKRWGCRGTTSGSGVARSHRTPRRDRSPPRPRACSPRERWCGRTASRQRRPSASSSVPASCRTRLPQTSTSVRPKVRSRWASASVCASTSESLRRADQRAAMRSPRRRLRSLSRALARTMPTPASRAASGGSARPRSPSARRSPA